MHGDRCSHLRYRGRLTQRLRPTARRQTAKLCYLGHLLTENRHGLMLDVELTQASGYAEREAALAMLDRCAAGGATLHRRVVWPRAAVPQPHHATRYFSV